MSDKQNPPLIQALRAKCQECGDCLIWQGNVSPQGVPMIKAGQKHSTPVRRIWLQAHGVSIEGKMAASTCGDQRCLSHAVAMTRVQHAKLVTRLTGHQKLLPRRAKLAAAARSRVGALTPQQVSEILASGESSEAIAKRLDRSKRTVQNVRQGLTYRDYSSPFAGLLGGRA